MELFDAPLSPTLNVKSAEHDMLFTRESRSPSEWRDEVKEAHVKELEQQIEHSERCIGKSTGEMLDQILENQIVLFKIFVQEAKDAK